LALRRCGSPDFKAPAVLFFNSGGLLAGHIIILVGFIVFTAAFWDIANRALLLLGLVVFTISTVFWISQRMILWSIMSLAPGDPDLAARGSELLRFLSQCRFGLAEVHFESGCLATAFFGSALWKCRWIGNIAGTIILIGCVILATMEVIGLLPPAFLYLFPYFMGVMILRPSNRIEMGTLQ